MKKPQLSPRVVLPFTGVLGLVSYVTAPCFLPLSLVDRFDFVALGFAVLIALPWLASCLEEFEIGGLKAKLRSVEEQAEAATETAVNAREIVDELAISARATGEEPQATILSQSPATAAPNDKDSTELTERMRELSRQYVTIRGSMSPGAARTAKMTEIFGLLQSMAKTIGPEQSDIADWLLHEDAGYQLAAIAWLRSHPESVKPVNLVAVIENSNQPFVQYWALRVLDEHAERTGITYFTPRDLRKLQQLEEQMRRKTDRWYQLRRINKRLSNEY